MTDVTRFLSAIDQGDAQAAGRHATSRHQLANCAAILIVLAAATVLSADDRGKPRGADRKAQNLEVTVLTPDGQPAAWAEGARAVPASQVFVRNGDIVKSLTNCEQHQTEATGRFYFAPAVDNSWLVVTHSSGFACVQCAPSDPPKVIRLTAWARAEGTYRVAGKLQPSVSINYEWVAPMPLGPNLPPVFFMSHATTDANGQFVLERLRPGPGRIGHGVRLAPDKETTEPASGLTVPAEFPQGKTTRIDLGGSGRPVIGQLRFAPQKLRDVSLTKALIQVRGDDSRPRIADLEFSATVNRDGNFCIDDVPPGSYIMSVLVIDRGDARIYVVHRFTVPTINEKLLQRPVDLGVLTPNTR